MAEHRPRERGERSPAQTTGMPVRETAQAVSAQISDTARQVSETASAYYAQGRETMEAYVRVSGGAYSRQAAPVHRDRGGGGVVTRITLEKIARSGVSPVLGV